MEQTTTQTQTEERPARRLVRSRDDRWFGGVATGLGKYFDVSPVIYRIVFAALAFAGGAGILLYLAAWLVIPDEGQETSIAEQALRDHRDKPVLAIGIGLVAFAGLIAVSNANVWPSPGNLWLVALVAGGGLVWWELRAARPATAGVSAGGGSGSGDPTTVVAPPAPRGPSLLLPVLGLLLVAGGIVGLLEALDVTSFDLRIVLAGAVILVGAATAFGAFTNRRVAGLVGLGLVLLVPLTVALAVDVPLRGGIGDRVERPLSAADTKGDYNLAVGQMTVDLRDVSVSEPTRVNVKVGVGEALVYVPRDASVTVRGHAGMGNVDVLGRSADGVGVDRDAVEAGAGPNILIQARVGVGDVEIRRG